MICERAFGLRILSLRAGAVFSSQGRFRREQVSFAGKARAWTRTAESGNALTFHLCPTCGSTVYSENEGLPGYVAVAAGSFADPNFPCLLPRCGLATPGSPCRWIRHLKRMAKQG